MTVTGLNLLRNTTLYSTYRTNKQFKTDAEYDEYLGELNVEDPDKFNSFFNFTITVRKDITDDQEEFDDVNENNLNFA